MRIIALIVVFLSFPIFVAWLRARPQHRHYATMAIGLMLFIGGSITISASLISWPYWPGTNRGITISPADSLALALIFTRRTGTNKLPFRALLGLYFAALLVSLLNSSVPMATAFACFQFVRLAVLFFAIGGEIARPRSLASLLTGLSLGLCLQAAYVIWQKLSGVVQATGTMQHQNTLGMMTELAVIPLAAAVLEGDRRVSTSAGVIAGLIVVAGSGSRGAMGITAAALIVLVVLSLWRRPTGRKMKVLGLGVLALAAIVPFGHETLRDRFGDAPFSTEETQRVAFERAARAMASDSPFGVGANLFVTVNNVEGYAARAGVAWNWANRRAPVHNAYLLARAETGWLGEIAFGLIFLVPTFTAITLAFSDRRNPAFGTALGAGIAVGAVGFHNLFEFVSHTHGPQALVMANLCIIAGLVRAKKKSGKTHASTKQLHGMSLPQRDLQPGTGRSTSPKQHSGNGRLTRAKYFDHANTHNKRN